MKILFGILGLFILAAAMIVGYLISFRNYPFRYLKKGDFVSERDEFRPSGQYEWQEARDIGRFVTRKMARQKQYRRYIGC